MSECNYPISFHSYLLLVDEARSVSQQLILESTHYDNDDPLSVLYSLFFSPIESAANGLVSLGIDMLLFFNNEPIKTDRELRQKLFDFAKKNLKNIEYVEKSKKRVVFRLSPKLIMMVSDNINTATDYQKVTFLLGGSKATVENYKKIQRKIIKEIIKEAFVDTFLSISDKLKSFLLKRFKSQVGD